MVWIAPLDVYEVLVNSLAGSADIFLFLAFLVIAVLAARFKMPLGVFIMMFLIFCVLIASQNSLIGTVVQGIIVFIIVGIAFAISVALNRRLGG